METLTIDGSSLEDAKDDRWSFFQGGENVHEALDDRWSFFQGGRIKEFFSLGAQGEEELFQGGGTVDVNSSQETVDVNSYNLLLNESLDEDHD